MKADDPEADSADGLEAILSRGSMAALAWLVNSSKYFRSEIPNAILSYYQQGFCLLWIKAWVTLDTIYIFSNNNDNVMLVHFSTTLSVHFALTGLTRQINEIRSSTESEPTGKSDRYSHVDNVTKL